MRAPEETEFKGYPVIKIYTGKEYNGEEEYITLGVRKARAIADNIDYIYRFVAKHDAKGG